MSIQTIYVRLVQAGMSPAGACAIMGNMQAESAMRANNVQDGMGCADADYTAAVDAGAVDFAGDGRGYGLCQWTYGLRKRNLLNFARARGVSIGNEEMQTDFCIHELQTEYASLWRYLTGAAGIYEAADRICREYERPAVNNVDIRAKFANEFYMSLGSMELPSSPPLGQPSQSEQWEAAESSLGAPPEKPKNEYWPPRMLGYGMFGPDVVALQGLLIAHGFPAGISGTFDNATAVQLRAFQRENRLSPDAVAGRLTWAALTGS